MPIWTEEKKERITNAAKPQKRERVMNLKQFLESVGGKESDIKVFKTHKESLVACEQDGYALQYVKDQTEAICKVACEQNGYALRYVKDQTEAICKVACEQNGDALQYVKDQTEAICKVACEQEGYALQYVKDQTEAICKVACEQNGDALQFVDVRVFAKLRPDDAKLKDALETISAYLRKND